MTRTNGSSVFSIFRSIGTADLQPKAAAEGIKDAGTCIGE